MWFKRNKKEQKKVEPKISDSAFSTNAFDAIDAMGEDDGGLTLSEIRSQYIEENATQREAPIPTGIAMDGCDAQAAAYQASFDNVNPHLLSYFIASSSFIGYHACALIAQHSLISRACSMKAEDGTRKGYDVTVNDGTELDEDQINQIKELDKKYKLNENMKEGSNFNAIFGVRHILFKNTDKNFDYEKPFNPDSFKDGKYAGMVQIDPYWITPEFESNDLVDPTSPSYYNPTYWIVGGKRYHRSHFVVLIGQEVADYLKPTYRYGGISLPQRIYERVYAAERTANEAPQLAMTKRTKVRKTDLAKAQANKSAFTKKLQMANELQDNYGTHVIGKDEEINHIDTSLADLDDVIMTQYQLVCSIAGIPATKLLGTSPKGFSTGETDSDYYIEEVEEVQGNEMTPIANAHYKRLIPSELGNISDGDFSIEINWRPLKVMSEKEMSEINLNKASTDATLYDRGAIDNIDIRQRLVNDKNSGYQGMTMPDEIEEDEQ